MSIFHIINFKKKQFMVRHSKKGMETRDLLRNVGLII